jgi:hypothetical protein
VVVGDFDFVGIAILPPETEPVLIIDPNTVLPRAAAPQPFQSIAGGNAQLPEVPNPVQLRQLAPDHGPERRWTRLTGPPTAQAIEEILRGAVRKGAYHARYYNGIRSNSPAYGFPFPAALPIRPPMTRPGMAKNSAAERTVEKWTEPV